MQLFKRHLNSRFRLHVAWLAGGAALGQAIQALGAPVLSRLYTPSAFGDLALLLSVAGIASSFAGLRYELGIVPAESDEDAAEVMAVQTVCNVIVAVLVLGVVLIFSRAIARAIGVPRLSFWLYFTPVIVFTTGAINALTFWFIRKQEFRRLAVFRVIQSVSGVGTQAAAGLRTGSPAGLIAGTLVGQVAFK